MSRMPQPQWGHHPQKGHPPYWCPGWHQCPHCLDIAARYYPAALRPEQRVARLFGGTGDSYSSYRAMHDHPFLVMGSAWANMTGRQWLTTFAILGGFVLLAIVASVIGY